MDIGPLGHDLENSQPSPRTSEAGPSTRSVLLTAPSPALSTSARLRSSPTSGGFGPYAPRARASAPTSPTSWRLGRARRDRRREVGDEVAVCFLF